MDSSNPYEAPRAAASPATLPQGDLAAAVADFPGSRGPILFLGAACIVLGLFSAASSIVFYGTAFGAMGSSVAIVLVALAANVVAYLIGGGSLLWMRHELSRLGASPSVDDVTGTFQGLARTWMILTGLLAVPILSTLAMSFMPLLLPVAGATIAGLTATNDVVVAARRWRDMVTTFLIVGAVMLVIRAGSSFVAQHFVPSSVGMMAAQAQIWTLGGVAVQVAFGFLVWKQIPALNAFLASPSAATLATVATTHRFVWRVTAWASIGVLILGAVVGAVLSVVMAF